MEGQMKYACLSLLLCSSLAAEGIFDSQTTLEHYALDIDVFYSTYLAEQRALDDDVGLAKGGRHPSSFDQPPNPPPPSFVTGYLPVVLVNRSGYPDSEVFFLVTGKNLSSINCWGNINTSTGITTLQAVQSGDNSTSFMVPFSSLPRSSTGRVAFLPQTIS
jgi:hypothetical protein